MFTLCKLLRGKNEIKLFPTILNVNLLSSLEAYICHLSPGLLDVSELLVAGKFTGIKNS